ncbi:MAG: hypothetical protein AAFP68_20375 [Pseudomonadota bacterium]
MTEDATLSAPMLHAAFMASCILLTILVYTVPYFDLRSLRLLARRKMQAALSDYDAAGGIARPETSDVFERPDLGAILSLLIITGTGLAMLVGWRIPAEIERIYGGGASFGILFPSVEMTTLGKGAQVVGAVCLGLTALRLLRLLVVFAAAGMIGLGGIAALNYVFDLNLLGLF